MEIAASTVNRACKDGQITGASFPQLIKSFSGKPELVSPLRFIFLMRTNARLCQTG